MVLCRDLSIICLMMRVNEEIGPSIFKIIFGPKFLSAI